MAKVVIIGGAGHVGTHLVPRLVEAGYEVTNITRGLAGPYQAHAAWGRVRQVVLDRAVEEASGRFGAVVAGMQPDVVIDMICFTPESNAQLADALAGKVQHFIHIGTIWVHGASKWTPSHEEDPRAPFGDYGVWKSQIEDDLLGRARRGVLPATVIRPGHMVGPGWAPLNPVGHFNPQVFRDMRDGKPLILPNFGLETVHHVHADDVAQAVMGALTHWSGAVGEAFNAVSPAALSLRGYAEAMYRHFGHEPQVSYAPYDAWAQGVAAEDAQATWEHIARSPCHAIDKARRLIGYAPRYSSLQAVQESVAVLLGQVG
ncbi:MAG: NAD-dependent epimerase/dehydratase family protein [bacterium]